MAVRIDAVGDYLQRTANLPSINSFTITGWCRVVADQGSGVIQPIVTLDDGVGLELLFLLWEGSLDGTMSVSSVTGGVQASGGDCASRPAVGTDFAWFLKCSG